MIATRFFGSIVGNNRLQSIFGSIKHNNMIVTCSMTDRIFNSTMILEEINQPGRLSLHIAPRALPNVEVVTIKTEGCVLTLGPQRCYK